MTALRRRSRSPTPVSLARTTRPRSRSRTPTATSSSRSRTPRSAPGATIRPTSRTSSDEARLQGRRGHVPRRLPGAAIVVVALLAWAPAAHAGSLSADGQTLHFRADAGEDNALAVAMDAGGGSISDLGAPLDPGDACDVTGDGAPCSGAVAALEIELGNGDDAVSLDTDLAASIDGGPGADFIAGGAGDDRVNSRDGEADDVSCGDGNDSVNADALDTIAEDCESVSLGERSGGNGSGVTAPPPGTGSSGPVGRSRSGSRLIECRRAGARLRCRLSGPASLRGRVTFTARRSAGGRAVGTAQVAHGKAAATLRSGGRLRAGVWAVDAVVSPRHGRPRVYRTVVALL